MGSNAPKGIKTKRGGQNDFGTCREEWLPTEFGFCKRLFREGNFIFKGHFNFGFLSRKRLNPKLGEPTGAQKTMGMIIWPLKIAFLLVFFLTKKFFI